MDFRQNSTQQVPQPTARPTVQETHTPGRKGKQKGDGLPSWLRWLYIVLLFAAVVVVVGVIVMLARGGQAESKYVEKGKYQAVFLNNGQVYFGTIRELNNNFVRVSGVYYLTQSTDASGKTSSNYTLVKLGCQQIHFPQDQMVINRSQITFWENLEDDGQVVKSIKEFQKQNPKGPDCSQVSNQTQASDTTSTQGSNSTTNQTQTPSTSPSTGTNNSTGSSTTGGSSSTTPKQ
ncbi:hypothetical protein EYC59_00790 [Candidatus Saccharibacteria bacterium]|nr:MAG: hypothetical protein EYC59_00790 [Candidatus Saccharibacteria bacterium]